MNCPKCGNPSHVLISRHRPVKQSINRRRECLQCGYRFTTIEIIVPEGSRPDPKKMMQNYEQGK